MNDCFNQSMYHLNGSQNVLTKTTNDFTRYEDLYINCFSWARDFCLEALCPCCLAPYRRKSKYWKQQLVYQVRDCSTIKDTFRSHDNVAFTRYSHLIQNDTCPAFPLVNSSPTDGHTDLTFDIFVLQKSAFRRIFLRGTYENEVRV